MKMTPTLEGGLRIDTEIPEEWEILRAIIFDAEDTAPDLAKRLGGLMAADQAAEDWREYVVPDLRDGFQEDVRRVNESIEAAIVKAGGEAGHLWIRPEDAHAWYSSLNQARLAIEEEFHFGPTDWIEAASLTDVERGAFDRSHLYSSIQGILLEYVMR